jgi:cytochrome c peroxidase
MRKALRRLRRSWVALPIGAILAVACEGQVNTPAATCHGPIPPGLIAPVASPASAAEIGLGKELFADRRLSLDGTVACITCHQPSRAFTDGRRTSVGSGGALGVRNAPTLYDSVYLPLLFWDGRASSLEQAAKGALLDRREMQMSNDLIERRVALYYPDFERRASEPVSTEAVAKAIAAYVRTLIIADSRVDRYLYCDDRNALTNEEKFGLQLFTGKANCVVCHTFSHESVHPFGGSLALYTDFRFHNTGAGNSPDPGRAAVTGDPRDQGALKRRRCGMLL